MNAQTIPKKYEGAPQEYPQAKLEKAFITEFLASKGYTLKEIHLLPKEVCRALMIEACMFASNKLAEIETRSMLIHELHGDM